MRRNAEPDRLDDRDRAADAYIVARTGTAGEPAGRTVIAGYPWFADWGRDTFISLRGLCLATGRRDDARAILCQWARAVSRGMLPNRFDERDATPEYNSVDAALWFVIAADAYLAGDATPGDRAAPPRAPSPPSSTAPRPAPATASASTTTASSPAACPASS